MASLNLWRRVAAPMASNGRMWKMASTTLTAPFSSGVESSAPVKVEKETSGPIKPEKQKVEKRKVFQKLKSLTVETIDLIIREEEKKDVFVDQENLVRWARLLKNRKPENALEIFRWMDKKKMVFSPSQLELYVDLLGKVKGDAAASAYFNKVEPNFDEMDVDAKNRPAYLKVLHWFDVTDQSQTKGAIPHVLKWPKLDDLQWAKNSTPTTPAQKRNLFSKLKSSETRCDDLLREMENQGFGITKADIKRWKTLLEKQGQTQKALQIESFKVWKYLSHFRLLRKTQSLR